MKAHPSVYLLLITALLVTVGCVVYVLGHEGFGQFFLVMASGTAGACVVLIMENR